MSFTPYPTAEVPKDMDCIGVTVFQVISAKGHANVVLSFTTYPTAEVPKDMDCIGYRLGYMSLDNEKAVRQEGLVTRSQAYDTTQVRLDMTAHLKPAL